MPLMTKRLKATEALSDRSKTYSVEEAMDIVKKAPPAKFDESVDLSLRLGVDPKHADQMVRGAIVLPHGIGKTVRVAVFDERDARPHGTGGPARQGAGSAGAHAQPEDGNGDLRRRARRARGQGGQGR